MTTLTEYDARTAAELALDTGDYWGAITAELQLIEVTKPTTAGQVIDILRTYDPAGGGGAFFGGSGGDATLFEALQLAGWQPLWWAAEYHWCAEHPDTGEGITYIEGDVYPERHPLPR